MKTLFIECDMGVAGDMLAGALWQLIDDKNNMISKINSLGLPNTQITFTPKVTCGIEGISARVLINGAEEQERVHTHHHSHMTLSDVYEIIDNLNTTDSVKSKAKKVYSVIAQAEGKVHNADVSVVHFHELGMMDAVADVTVCSLLMEQIALDRIVVSPINAGSGSVKCAHGILPIPAPATAEILNGIPYYKSNIKGELCTPTGAALVKAFANEFSQMPLMTVDKIGYGVGSKEFDKANVVRVFLGEGESTFNDYISEIVCNVDDMTAEDIAFACEILLEAGALDVYTQPAFMKKSRLGTLLTVLCRKEDRDKMVSLIFKNTKTIGIRERECRRYILDRKSETIDTPLGRVRVKASKGYGCSKKKYEFDDLKRLAKDNNMSIESIRNTIDKYS